MRPARPPVAFSLVDTDVPCERCGAGLAVRCSGRGRNGTSHLRRSKLARAVRQLLAEALQGERAA